MIIRRRRPRAKREEGKKSTLSIERRSQKFVPTPPSESVTGFASTSSLQINATLHAATNLVQWRPPFFPKIEESLILCWLGKGAAHLAALPATAEACASG